VIGGAGQCGIVLSSIGVGDLAMASNTSASRAASPSVICRTAGDPPRHHIVIVKALL